MSPYSTPADDDRPAFAIAYALTAAYGFLLGAAAVAVLWWLS